MFKDLIAFTLLVVVLWYALRLFERSSIYYPYPEIEGTPDTINLSYEDVYFKTEDGLVLNGWFVPASVPAPKILAQELTSSLTVLFCHGNAGNISHRLDKIRIFHDLGLNVFIFDYRGYGKSKRNSPILPFCGRLSEKGTYRDALAAYHYLTGKRNISPGKIVIYGESLGGNIAIHLAGRTKVGFLISDSAFTSTVDMGRIVYPYLPVKWMVSYRYDALNKIQNVKIPVLIIHSKNDEIVPFQHAQAIFEAANEPKAMFVLSGSHNDGFFTAATEYSKHIYEFLLKHSTPSVKSDTTPK